jgi:3D (Asp-Asp-Asp) domain-containing protein
MKLLKLIIILICCFGFIGCETTQGIKVKNAYKKGMARVTFYCAREDSKYRNKIAASSKMRAQEGRTIAVNPREFPYWSKIRIPFLSRLFNNGGMFTAEDTGKHVRSRKASKGQFPVVDVYVSSKKKMNLFAATIPPYLDIEY